VVAHARCVNTNGELALKIVIIDDNPVNVVVVKSLVKQLPGCEPVEFTDPHARH
jgi:hypothetical protein